MNQKGFSLVEIMVALALIAAILIGLPIGNPLSDRSLMNNSIETVDRALRFASGEAVLRNVIVRVQFDLDTTPQEFVVEYANSRKLTLTQEQDMSKMSLLEREKAEKKKQDFNRNFTISPDFSDGAVKLDDDIQLEGLANSYLNEIVRTGKVGVYFYPTGERDNAALFFSSYSEVATLAVSSFETKTYTSFLALEEVDEVAYDSHKNNKIEELYDIWLKE